MILAGFCLQSQPSSAQSLTLNQVTHQIEKARDAVTDLQADADFGFQVIMGIIPYRDTLHGTYFFKKPDKHRLDFPDAPSYLKSLPSMFSWKLPSLEKYEAKVIGPLAEGDTHFYSLVFTPKNLDSKTHSINTRVDSSNWRITRQDTYYKDGGSVLLRFAYLEKDGVSLLESVLGDVTLRDFKLSGQAQLRFSGHQLNRGLADSIFEGS